MDLKFMKAAIKEARKAESSGDVPIGCVIVMGGKIVSRGHNKKEASKNPTRHAEIEAIERAAKKIGDWRLLGAELYVTLEPCLMCSGAILNSRVDKLYFGAYDPKSGACETLYNVLSDDRLNHKTEVTGGIMEAECAKLLSDFFKERRKK